MPRLLIVSPHFPPTDAPDMHRVRMNVGHYEAYGWQPTVLSVDARSVGRLIDDDLAKTLPPHLEAMQSGAIPRWLAAPFGITAVGLRALSTLAALGDKCLGERQFDLVFISTTAFPVMVLGARWRRKFGVPYVLDMQDPWYTSPPGARQFMRPGLKHGLMRGLHAALERYAVGNASGIIAVSPDYIEALRNVFPHLDKAECETIPFGYANSDFATAQQFGSSLLVSRRVNGMPTCVFAGRIAPAMLNPLRALFTAIALDASVGEQTLSKINWFFVGTGYQPTGNPKIAESVAGEFQGLRNVTEMADRVPLLDSIQTLAQADMLLLLGSEDRSYQPSKLYQYLRLNKPILCVAPSDSHLATAVCGLETVVFLPSDKPLDAKAVSDVSKQLRQLASRHDFLTEDRVHRSEAHEANAVAERECALFSRVLHGAAA